MPISFDQPAWLIALAAVPLVLVLGGRAVAPVRRRQHQAATYARAATVGLLVLGLAAPRWDATGRDVDLVVLVDASDSVGPSGRAAALGWLDAALDDKPGGDRVALALFGRDARLEHSLRVDPPRVPPATVVDGSATDLAQALRLGHGVLGSERRRRAILITDGRETQGDAVRAAEELARAGVSVDVVRLPTGLTADVLVAEVSAPSRVRDGEAFDVVAVLANTGPTSADAVVTVSADGVEVHRETLTLPPGFTSVRVPRVADRPGTVRYEARLQSAASTILHNDVGRAAVQVEGPARVLVYEGRDNLGADLDHALDAGGIGIDRLSAAARPLPSLDRLLDYDAVVLVDVPADAIGQPGMQALDAYVRDAGRGLVAVGGDGSFGMGGYDGTTLEDLLPVFARVKDPRRRPSVAQALVVDASGSMAACHCQGDGFGGRQIDLNVEKTTIAKEGIARAIDALEQQDIVGVLAFSTQNQWVLPLQHIPDVGVVDEALARIRPEGGTSIPQAVREAIAGLKDTNARLRHIVLFTDGWTEEGGLIEVAREAAAAGITLSVVGTGEGTGEVLREMASVGGGRFYPGRDLFSIPDIIVSEVQFAARPIVNEGVFLPIVTAVDPATEGLTAAPPLLGYLATTAKPASRTLLAIGPERDPLLATWQAGLGTAVAWTSDAAPRWSAEWVTWERFARFWSDVVKATFPADPDARFALSASATPDGLRVTLDAAEPIPADATGSIVVTFPDGTRVEVPLERTGLDAFEAALAGGVEGVYAVTARLDRGGVEVYRHTVTAIRSYSPEYSAAPPDPTLADRIAAAGGGRVDPDPAVAFDRAGLVPGSSSTPLWSWFALLALLLLPVDVGLRRLRLERGDWSRARAAIARKLRRATTPEVAERRETTEGLMAAKRRSRARLGEPSQDDAAPDGGARDEP